MYTLLILVLLLWYFWYFYLDFSKPLAKPKQGSPNPAPKYDPQFDFYQKKFRFRVNGRIVWEDNIPPTFTFHNKRIVEQDVCHGQADGRKVLAQGYVLYQYLKKHPHLQSLHFKKDATSIVQKGHVFYFTCHKQHIQELNQCPSGHLFVRGQCEIIQPCTGEKDGVLLPDPNNKRHYFRCEGGNAIKEQCPADQFFLLDNCRLQKDLAYYCQFFNESFLMNESKTRVDCVMGKPEFTSCPDAHKFFEKDGECEPITCENEADGNFISMNRLVDGNFAYYPGYMRCERGRLLEAVDCPSIWDSNDPSNIDNLQHLPMVFDGQKCAIPTFCTNLEPVDDEIIVPVYEWRRHVANWEKASMYDHLEGYKCGLNQTRTRVAMSPGESISNKRFKRESACQGGPPLIPVSGEADKYFDCVAKTIKTCPPGEKFNGTTCQAPLTHPFRYQHLDLFQLDSLSHDNWIVPWKYTPPTVPHVTCNATDIKLELYNICSHPDCVNYPFLLQIPSFSVYHPQGFQCAYDPNDRHIKKKKINVHPTFDFWSQSRNQRICSIGQHLMTGHFVFDNLLYATCDSNQPFVFCPSSETQGILKVREGKYACQLPQYKEQTSEFRETTTVHFEMNEIIRIRPTHPNQQIQTRKGGPWLTLPDKGQKITEAIDLTVHAPVLIDYQYRVTHPPDIVFHQDKYEVSSKGGGFICKRKDFTHHRLNFPEYKVQAFVGDFHV